MARGRIFRWQDADGNSLLLSDKANGIRVLQGVLGLGAPNFNIDKSVSPDVDGYSARGVRGAARQIFLPIEVTGPDRKTLLQRAQGITYRLNPKRGPGWLYITDGGSTYRICGYYSGGLEGDESDGSAGELDGDHWAKKGITIDCTKLYFEFPSPTIIGPYGYVGTVPFFPILPVRLNPSQVLSDASQPAVINTLFNPSFELGATTDWSGNFFTSPAVIGTPTNLFADAGSKSCRLDFSPAVSGDSGTFFSSGDSVPLVVGQTYTIKIRVLVPSGQPPVRLSSWDGVSAQNQTFDQWETLALTFVCNFSTAKFLGINQINTAGANDHGGYCYIDKAMHVAGGDPGGYIDGDQANCHWTGTPHNSTSYRDPAYAPTKIINVGTENTEPVINVTGPGSVVDLYHRDADQHVTLNYAIPAGRTVKFDFRDSPTVLLDDGTNLFGHLSADDFWTLRPGDNYVSLSLTGAAAGAQISGYFNPRLLSLV